MSPSELEILLAQIQYPGVTEDESEVVRAWLRAHGLEYDRIVFKERLGKGTELDDTFDEATRRQAALVTQKRLDVLAWKAGAALLVEAKVRAGLSVLGQLLGYRVLFIEKYPDVRDVDLLLIAQSFDDDAELAYRAHGLKYELFPEAVKR